MVLFPWAWLRMTPKGGPSSIILSSTLSLNSLAAPVVTCTILILDSEGIIIPKDPNDLVRILVSTELRLVMMKLQAESLRRNNGTILVCTKVD